MIKRNNLNYIEKLLLEKKLPSLKILLEDEEKQSKTKESKPAENKSSSTDSSRQSSSGDSAAADNNTGGDTGGTGGGLDDLFADSGSGGDTGDGEEGGGDAGGGDIFAGGGGDPNAQQDISQQSADPEKEKDEKEKKIKKGLKLAADTLYDVSSGGFDPNISHQITQNLFDIKNESRFYNKNKKKLIENISKFLFKNVKDYDIKKYKKLSLKDKSFYLNEKKLLRMNKILLENETDDIIGDKFWQENAPIDAIVNNAVELTNNFIDKVDIPSLIINSVSIKFGKMAGEEQEENKNAPNEYKQKLADFIQKYTSALKNIPDYKNYPTDKFAVNSNIPDIQAVGASNSQ